MSVSLWCMVASLFLYQCSVLYSSAPSQQHASPDSQIKHGVCHTQTCAEARQGSPNDCNKKQMQMITLGFPLVWNLSLSHWLSGWITAIVCGHGVLENKHQLGQRRQQQCNNNNTIICYIEWQDKTIFGEEWWVTADQNHTLLVPVIKLTCLLCKVVDKTYDQLIKRWIVNDKAVQKYPLWSR